VGEHTDYGLLAILKQDDLGGLQVKTKSGWIDAVPIANSFVCNIGDMLDRLTKKIGRSVAEG
jgi:isopenicillin N synthase-like dioxygenase